jgi:hypothetical protein
MRSQDDHSVDSRAPNQAVADPDFEVLSRNIFNYFLETFIVMNRDRIALRLTIIPLAGWITTHFVARCRQ